MPRDDDSEMEDAGRKESEKHLRSNRPKYLSDVLEQADADHDDIVAMLEKKAESVQADDGLVATVDAILADNTRSASTDTHISSARSLISSCNALLQLHEKANQAIMSSGAEANPAATLSARVSDRERVKQILAAGKRVFEGELEAVRRQALAEEANDGRETADLAISLFGGSVEQAERNVAANRTLSYVERGVVKITRGLDRES